jgi:hypothetical protein
MAPRVSKQVAVKATSKPAAKAPAPLRGRPFTSDDARINKTKPGPGRPPSVIRDAYRMAAADRLAFVLDVVDGHIPADPADRLRAWDLLNKYGIGTTITQTDTDGKDAAPGRLTPEAMRAAVAGILGVQP